MSEKVKVHGFRAFTRDCRPRWVLAEAGVPFETQSVNLFAGEHKQPAFTAINPAGKIPFVEDGDAALSESGAQAIYLAEKYAADKLVPPQGTPCRAKYYQWIFYAVTELEPVSVKLFANGCLFAHKEGAEERRREAQVEFDKAVEPLEAALTSGGPHILGERFTTADILLGTTLAWAEKGKGLENHPTLRAYLERLSKRAGFEQTYSWNASFEVPATL